MQRHGVVVLIKDWRRWRRPSQLELAVLSGVSATHLSFVETGRSKPSPELLLTLARPPDVPLRELNLFTTLTTFGTPQDITLDERAVELFFPADAFTDEALRAGGNAVFEPVAVT